jgi:hypothetical protein
LTNIRKENPDVSQQKAMELAIGRVKGDGFELDSAIENAVLEPINEVIRRINADLVNGSQNISKLLGASEGNINKMNELVQMVQTIQGLLRVLEGVLEATHGDYNPCGDGIDYDRARRFFNRVKLPGSKVVIDPSDNPDNPDDVNITIVKDPIQIENPVVEDILRSRGAQVFEAEDQVKYVDANTINGGPGGNISFSLFACLGSAKNEE